MARTRPPELLGVLETVLYYSDQAPIEEFYSRVLGMTLIAREPSRHLFYRAGRSVFLLFDRAAVRQTESLPAHGADGSVHTCLQVPPESYEDWKRHLEAEGVPLLQETRWERGISFYFHDPAGNLLEIANADIWPVSGTEEKS